MYGAASAPSGTFTQVDAGDYHTCGVTTNGIVGCWGSNARGKASPPFGLFRQVSAGRSHTRGVKTDGTVACWGLPFDRGTPPAGAFSQISDGYAHTCGVRPDGTAACWGRNELFQSSPPKVPQSVTFTLTPPARAAVGGATYTATGTATSGLDVTFNAGPSIA